MDQERLRYDVFVQDAMMGVVRRALAHAAENGLPGEHHFYLTFRTSFPGVEMPDWLLARYPEEMTIVVQYEYSDLVVGMDSFSITLSFDDRPSRLNVPFKSIANFFDPSVKFGLQFQVSTDTDADDDADEDDLDDDAGAEPGEGHAPAPPDGDAQVISLDAFRKKP